MSAFKLFFVLAGLAGLAACSAPPAEASDDDSQALAASGYKAFANPRGVYQSVAVVGDRAFIGDNARTIDVVDLKSMAKTGSVAARVVSDSLTSAGNKVIACGLRDDSPLAPFGHTPADRSYVLTVIDAETLRVDGEIKLAIESFLQSNPATGFVDLPDLSCRFDESTKSMTVTFAQEDLGREVVRFPLPPIGSTHPWNAIPRAERTRIDVGGDRTMLAASQTDEATIYAAGGWGLRVQARGTTRAKTLRDEGREHMVDLQLRGGAIYAVDHDGGLVIANERDGKTIERVEIPDYLHGIALTPSHVVVVGRGGLFVAPDRWSR